MATRSALKSPYEIVVPTDFSPGSSRAMMFALALAGPGISVTAVHAVDPFQYTFGPQKSRQLRRQQAWAAAQKSMAVWLQEGNFCNASAAVIEGEAAPAIAEFVASQSADLVVVGTSGRRHARRLLLGSVAEEMFRDIKCPVVVLGPKARVLKRRKLARLAFATDLEPHSLAALSELSKLSNKFHSSVAVIRAVPHAAELPGERNRIRKETQEKFKAAADQSLVKRTQRVHIAFAPPTQAITGFANRLRADAIIMGIRSGGELIRAATHIPWTLAHRVIAEARCPVITIRG
jgi:nucleotide-binding universal stress UspA family protein